MHTDDYFELLRNQPAITEQEVRAIVDAYPLDKAATRPTPQGLSWLWVLLLSPLLIWLAAHNLLKDSEPAATIQSNHSTATATIPALSDTSVVATDIPIPAISNSTKKRTAAIAPRTSPSLPDSLTISAPFSPVVRGDSGVFHYGFPVGRRLVYRKIDDHVDTAFQESTLFTAEASITVQERDTAGNHQLVLTIINEQQTDRLKPVQSFSTMSFAADILSLHTTVAPQGNYLAGRVIKNSKEREEMLQRAKQPNFQGHVATDESILRSTVESWLTVLPKRSGFTVGDTWSDTLNSSQTIKPIGVKYGDTAAITITSQTISNYTVGNDTLINNTLCIQLHIEAVKRDELPGRSATFATTKQVFFRKRDGVVIREIGQHIFISNQQPGAWTKITKELIAEE